MLPVPPEAPPAPCWRGASGAPKTSRLSVNGAGRNLANRQPIAKGMPKMRKFTFQIGSEFDGSQRTDQPFQRALDSIRNALGQPAPIPVPVRKPRRSLTRFEARLLTVSRGS